MNILYLTLKPDTYSAQRIREAAEERGHSFIALDPHDFQIEVSGAEGSAFHKGEQFEDVEVVLPRFGPAVGEHGLAVIRHFENREILTVNASRPLELARDKLLCCQHLSGAGLPVPRSLLVRTSEEFRKLRHLLPTDRYVLKLPVGAYGIGVMLAESTDAAESIIDTMWGLKNTVLVQEYLEAAVKQDKRLLVIGDEVVAAMLRKAPDGSFRTNIRQGGSAHPYEPTPAEKQLALRAAMAIGLDIAGVDFIDTDRGLVITEVNASPGLEGVESATGLNIAGRIIDHVEARLNEKDR